MKSGHNVRAGEDWTQKRTGDWKVDVIKWIYLGRGELGYQETRNRFRVWVGGKGGSVSGCCGCCVQGVPSRCS